MRLDSVLEALANARDERARRAIVREHPSVLTLESVETLKRETESRLRVGIREAERSARAVEFLARRLDTDAARARALLARGFLDHARGRYGRARDQYRRAESLLRRAGEGPAADRVLLALVDALAWLSDDEGARKTAAKARRAFLRRGDRRWAAMVDMNLGNVHHRAGRLKAALVCLGRADRFLAEEGLASGRAINDLNRANVLTLLGEHGEALALYRSSVKTLRDVKRLVPAAQADYNAATALFLRGEFSAALERLAGVEPFFEAEGDRRHLALIRLDRADILLRLGQPGPAAEEASRARAAFRKLGLPGEAALARAFAAIARADSRGRRGRKDLHDAAAALRDAGRTRWAAVVELHEAGLRLRAGDPDGAAALARKVRPALRRASMPDRAALAALVAARADEAAGRTALAARGYRRVLDDLAGLPLPWISWRARHGLARIARGKGDRRAAGRQFAAAVRDLETVRDALAGDEVRGGLAEEAAPLYEDSVIHLLEGRGRDRVEKAFELLERARSRALLGDVETLPHAGRFAGHPQARRILEELRELQARVAAALHGERVRGERRAVPARLTPSTLRSADRRARTLRIRLESAAGPGALTDRPVAPGLRELRAALRPGETLVSYAVLGGRLRAFLLTRDGLSGPHDLGDLAAVERLVADLRLDLTKPPAHPAFEPTATRAAERRLSDLHGVLVAPLLDRIADGPIAVSPWGLLHAVPFHALLGPDGRLGAGRAVVRTPSAGALWLSRTRRRRRRGAPVVLGLPDRDAPRVRAECEGLARALPDAGVECGDGATGERLREAARRGARLLHVATHGMFSDEVPRLAAFRLADGWFGLGEVYDLDLRADLVFLSSCDGARGGVLRSGEALGLARAFLRVGARSFLAALGPVRDDAAEAFTASFYAALLDGAGVGEAHRRAVTETRARYPHPAHWATFVLHGDGTAYPLRVRR